MFGLFKRNSNGDGAKPSLDAVRFDATGYAFQGEPQPGNVRIWRTQEGDGVGLYFFAMRPDLPSDAASADELAVFYRQLLGNSGGKLVDLAVVVAGGCPAVRTILSVPQQPSGRTYVGSLTLPFRDFSFVLKCQCAERGPTGFKEALLFDRSPAANRSLQTEGERLDCPEWNPDDPQYDAEFPDHPVARVRRVLDQVAESLAVDESMRRFPGFALPRK